MARYLPLLDTSPEDIVNRVARSGLVKARKQLRIGVNAWMALLERHPKLAEHVALAEAFHLEGLSPRLLADAEAADDDFKLKKAKLIGDRIAWLLERRLPDRYGNKVQHSLAVTFDLRVAVDEAKERVAAITVEVIPDAVTRLLG